MKAYSIICLLILFCIGCQAQEFAGYQIIDYLRTVDHPNCSFSKNKYITGPPNDSMWVNIVEEDTIFGEFGSAWSNGEGNEIILHSAFNLDKYRVKLKLADGSYSEEHLVNSNDWESLEDNILWTYISDENVDCMEYSGVANQRIVELDFQEDFGLGPYKQVIGIELIFLLSSGATDISGIYITENATIPCTSAELGNDFVMCSSDSTILSPGDFQSYLWNDLSMDSILLIDGLLLGETIHSYHVKVEDENGCVTRDTIHVTIEKCWDFDVTSLCKNIIIYPNPANQYLNFQFKEFENDKELLIYSADGRLIDQIALNMNNLILDISTYSSGIYFAKTNETCCKFAKLLSD